MEVLNFAISIVWLLVGIMIIGGGLFIYTIVKRVTNWFNHFKGISNAFDDMKFHIKAIVKKK